MIEWFRHDVHCLQDDRLFALVSRYGAEGYAVFFHTIETMYANDGNPISDITIRRIAFDLSMPYEKVHGIIEFAASDSCGNLFESHPEGFSSGRVLREVEYQEFQRMKYSNMGKASAKRRLEQKSNVGSTQVERKLNAGSTHNITRQDNTNNKLSNDNFCSELFNNSSEAEEKDPVFITIPLLSGADHPIRESDVKIWEEAYPAVDVRGQLREMKAWCNSNPKERKTERGIMRFCNNWLSREQDKSGRFDAKSKPVKHKDYSDISDEALEKEFHWT